MGFGGVSHRVESISSAAQPPRGVWGAARPAAHLMGHGQLPAPWSRSGEKVLPSGHWTKLPYSLELGARKGRPPPEEGGARPCCMEGAQPIPCQLELRTRPGVLPPPQASATHQGIWGGSPPASSCSGGSLGSSACGRSGSGATSLHIPAPTVWAMSWNTDLSRVSQPEGNLKGRARSQAGTCPRAPGLGEAGPGGRLGPAGEGTSSIPSLKDPDGPCSHRGITSPPKCSHLWGRQMPRARPSSDSPLA